MTDFVEQVPDRSTSTAISQQQVAALQARLRREAASTDPRDVGGLKQPVAEEQVRDQIKKS